jgi:predicted HicB family RNase H-like nuclease
MARCLEFPSLGAHGNTIEEALREIKYVVAESVKWMQEEGEAAPEPLGLKKFKGLLTLRIPPEKHRDLAIRCAEEGISLNRFILSRLAT